MAATIPEQRIKKAPIPLYTMRAPSKVFSVRFAAGKAALKVFHQDSQRIFFQGFQETGILCLGQRLFPSFYLHDLTSLDLLSPDGDFISLRLRLI
jgi:hypothetical protein